jgi:two-component system chemotaxis response regulator CheB
MFSSLTERAATATLEALARGANDYVTKPSGASGLAGAMQRVRDELVPKLRHFGGQSIPTSGPPALGVSRAPALGVSRAPLLATSAVPPRVTWTAPEPGRSGAPAPGGSLKPPMPNAGPPTGRRAKAGIDIVALGCSTGGPNALSQLFAQLRPSLPVPIVITQHMPPVFTRLLAERLTASTPFTVHEARNGDVLVPGQAWLAPGDHHLCLYRAGNEVRIRLTDDPPENSCRPAVDVMFRSVSAVYGSRVLGVILTGMGQDGLRGCQELHDLGAEIVVQDQASSVVWGMPGLVARAGLASAVVPIGRVADELVRAASIGRALSVPAERRA